MPWPPHRAARLTRPQSVAPTHAFPVRVGAPNSLSFATIEYRKRAAPRERMGCQLRRDELVVFGGEAANEEILPRGSTVAGAMAKGRRWVRNGTHDLCQERLRSRTEIKLATPTAAKSTQRVTMPR